jgi:hypothetical protein
LFLLGMAAVTFLPVFAEAQVLAHESFSVVNGGGQSGDAIYTTDMVFNGYYHNPYAQDGYSWSSGAGAVQGALSQNLFSSPNTNPPVIVYAPAANVAFKFDIGSAVDALNATYGAGNWTIANPTFYIQYTLYANNPRFGGASRLSLPPMILWRRILLSRRQRTN